MKWGVQNGPPYPIEDKAAAEASRASARELDDEVKEIEKMEKYDDIVNEKADEISRCWNFNDRWDHWESSVGIENSLFDFSVQGKRGQKEQPSKEDSIIAAKSAASIESSMTEILKQTADILADRDNGTKLGAKIASKLIQSSSEAEMGFIYLSEIRSATVVFVDHSDMHSIWAEIEMSEDGKFKRVIRADLDG